MDNAKIKRKQQLGIDVGTATNRLYKDILFDFIIKAGHKCFRCEKDLTRETFSVEHKIPWLDSEDPVVNFFDLSNIAYSHMVCNSSAGRRPTRILRTQEDRREIWREAWDRRAERKLAKKNAVLRQLIREDID